MIDCRAVQEQIAGLCDPETAFGQQAINDHLIECEACAGVAEALSQLDMDALELPFRQTPADILARTLASVHEERSHVVRFPTRHAALVRRELAGESAPRAADPSEASPRAGTADVEFTHGWMWAFGLAAAAVIIVFWTIRDQQHGFVSEPRAPGAFEAQTPDFEPLGWRQTTTTTTAKPSRDHEYKYKPNGKHPFASATGKDMERTKDAYRDSTENVDLLDEDEGEGRDGDEDDDKEKEEEGEAEKYAHGDSKNDWNGDMLAPLERNKDGRASASSFAFRALIDDEKHLAKPDSGALSIVEHIGDAVADSGGVTIADQLIDDKPGYFGKSENRPLQQSTRNGVDAGQKESLSIKRPPVGGTDDLSEISTIVTQNKPASAKTQTTFELLQTEDGKKNSQPYANEPSDITMSPSSVNKQRDVPLAVAEKTTRKDTGNKRETKENAALMVEANEQRKRDESKLQLKISGLKHGWNREKTGEESERYDYDIRGEQGQYATKITEQFNEKEQALARMQDSGILGVLGNQETMTGTRLGELLSDGQTLQPSNKDIEYARKGERDRWWSDGRFGPDTLAGIDGQARLLARALLDERARITGVATKPTNGMWSNTYVPGDPVVRLLQGRLARMRGDGRDMRVPALERTVRPYLQAFDAPKTSALGVSVRADRRATEGPARVLLQVGLQGTARRSGRRPAMNIAIVLDLRADESAEERAGIKALLMALRETKQPGDRFSLVVAGRPGGALLVPAQFRHGPLTVAIRRLFGDTNAQTTAPTLTLEQAVAHAASAVSARDDGNAALGTSMVLLVTGARLPSATFGHLRQSAHDRAVDGIGMSVIGIGQRVDADQLTHLAAAGQGSRRLLERAVDAADVVGAELAAAASVVARAVRVRVKLAPGVKLVGIIGSTQLDAEATRRVRQAEKSIDRRMQRARGIASDREDDQDGVQMVIPSFFADDAHVILLDVIAPGSGPLADITVRYKDLAFSQNGVARGSLYLTRGTRIPTSLETGVFKNYIAHVIARDLRTAGTLIADGSTAAATATITKLDAMLRGLEQALPYLQGDDEFERDRTLIRDYLRLATGVDTNTQDLVSDSLRYAGWRKLIRIRDDNPSSI